MVLRGPRKPLVVTDPTPPYLRASPEARPMGRATGPLEAGAPAAAEEAEAGVEARVPYATTGLPSP